jgi:hypothetical protein
LILFHAIKWLLPIALRLITNNHELVVINECHAFNIAVYSLASVRLWEVEDLTNFIIENEAKSETTSNRAEFFKD